MITTRSRKTRIVAGALGAAAVVGASVFGIAAPASAATGDPTVTKLSAKRGSTTSVTNILITGKNFTTATGVDVVGTPVTSFSIIGDTMISAIIPTAHAVGSGRVVVTNPIGTNADTAADDFTFATPITATVAAATLLNPLGKSAFIVTSDLSLGSDATAFKALKVTASVGGVAATAAWASATTATVTAPIGTPSGTAVNVALNLDGVAGTPDTTNTKYAAVITGLSKTSSKLAGGATVTITGKGFTGATAWVFAAVPATSCAQVSAAKVDTAWTCVVPAAVGAGPVTVSFTSGAGVPATVGTLGGTFTYSDVS